MAWCVGSQCMPHMGKLPLAHASKTHKIVKEKVSNTKHMAWCAGSKSMPHNGKSLLTNASKSKK